MLHVAFLCLLVGQLPPLPPVPHPPDSYEQSSSSSSASSSAQREWLLAHLIVDMQAQGKYDAQKYHDIERMLNNMTPSQLGVLVEYYQQRKAQVEAWQQREAEADLHRLQAYRDSLKRELEWKIATRRQEQAITAYGSALAAQQTQWAMQNFYAARAWPSNRPFYYPHHHHYHW
jgi:hypothetical protein